MRLSLFTLFDPNIRPDKRDPTCRKHPPQHARVSRDKVLLIQSLTACKQVCEKSRNTLYAIHLGHMGSIRVFHKKDF